MSLAGRGDKMKVKEKKGSVWKLKRGEKKRGEERRGDSGGYLLINEMEPILILILMLILIYMLMLIYIFNLQEM